MSTARFVLALAATAGAASSAIAAIGDINGLRIRTNNFYDHTNAFDQFYIHNGGPGVPFAPVQNGVISASGLSGTHTITEKYPAADDGAGGNFANRHLAFLSSDGGMTDYDFDGTESFFFCARVTMRTFGVNWAPGESRNIEAGFMLTIPHDGGAWTNEGLVLAGSNGTSFANDGFTGGVFSLFGEGNGTGIPLITGAPDPGNPNYTMGGADISFAYISPADGGGTSYTQVTVRDLNSGVQKIFSWLPLSNSAFALVPGSHLGFWVQDAKQQFIIGSEYETTFSNIKIIPAPGSVALLGLGALVVGRRRR
ncbi:MAG TPA: PEP-CTERM sorting domain-containing protein [Phycisphaerales bacterium]|nr:PEP-CTERM sorting domain-containing protein [Phycisphaerales bacterium]